MSVKSTIGCLPPPRHVETKGRDLSPPTDKAGRLSLQHQNGKINTSSPKSKRTLHIKHAALLPADGKETAFSSLVSQSERGSRRREGGTS